MPHQTYITAEEKRLPGHKPMKDRLTLALCVSASVDFKVKPLLVYHSNTPRAFKTHKVVKESLNVLWRANGKAWVTRQLFIEWINICFGPTVKKYLEENRLLVKCLLVLDNVPAHPPSLHEDIAPQYSFVKILYLPPHSSPLLQPMDQRVISNFMKLYTKYLEHFDIVICLKMIDQAWQEISRRTLNSAWTKLWSEDDSENVDDPEPDAQSEVAKIVTLRKSMGLEVDETDIDELIQEHQDELTTDDLKELEVMLVNVIQEEYSGGEEDEPLTTAEIKEDLDGYFKMATLVEKRHPEKILAVRALEYCNEVCLSYFRNILRCRQKQASLDAYFSKRPLVEADQAPAKKQKKCGNDEENA
ncbi:tigger transposable element-derived protein 1-like [Palaemon carinicauda]|uniref:tigger transposable element-derived protein 1-like n=1 Tax=Palaemon carinicauda TaxID=392227 RepID=UPI0035B6A189